MSTQNKNDVDVQKESVDYSGKKLKEHPYLSKDVYKANLAANGLSHGFYMGNKWAASAYGGIFWTRKPPMTEEKIRNEASSAVDFYKKKKLKNHNIEDRILITTFLSVGFVDGVRKYEESL